MKNHTKSLNRSKSNRNQNKEGSKEMKVLQTEVKRKRRSIQTPPIIDLNVDKGKLPLDDFGKIMVNSKGC